MNDHREGERDMAEQSRKMQHLRRMADRVVLITGGGGGIAQGISRAFADEGAGTHSDRSLSGRNGKDEKNARRRLRHAEVLTVIADGYNEDDVKNALQAGIDRFGKINVIINNAQASASGKTLIRHSGRL